MDVSPPVNPRQAAIEYLMMIGFMNTEDKDDQESVNMSADGIKWALMELGVSMEEITRYGRRLMGIFEQVEGVMEYGDYQGNCN